MKNASKVRLALLRNLCGLSVENPNSPFALESVLSNFDDLYSSDLVFLVIEDLSAEGFIKTSKVDGHEMLILTAKGFYEAERLGGPARVGFIDRFVGFFKNHRTLSLIIGISAIVVSVAYPEYKEWLDQKAIAVTMEDAKGTAAILNDSARGMREIEHLMSTTTYCESFPEVRYYNDISCEILRNERVSTESEARDFCKNFPHIVQFGGRECSEFRD